MCDVKVFNDGVLLFWHTNGHKCSPPGPRRRASCSASFQIQRCLNASLRLSRTSLAMTSSRHLLTCSRPHSCSMQMSIRWVGVVFRLASVFHRCPCGLHTFEPINFDHAEYFMTFDWRGNGRAKDFFVILGLTFACFFMTLGYDICLAASGYL